MGSRITYSGLVVAGVGFFLTRFTVTLAVEQPPSQFYLAGVVPLSLGLGLAAFGVALTVADVDAGLVRTTARWCVAGTGAMLVLVVLTLAGSSPGGMLDLETVRSRSSLSNFTIGGAIGGTLTGLYAARARRQRDDLMRHTNRLEVLNRLLRHEILNAVTAIRGYAALSEHDDYDAGSVIESRSDGIEETIEEVKYLTRDAGRGQAATGPTDVERVLERSVAPVRKDHPDATITVGGVPDGLAVVANERLEHVVRNLVENAVVHAGTVAPAVDVSVEMTAATVAISVTDDGPGLPSDERALLEDGDIGDFDEPGTGFGLNVVRLLVESYRGAIETDVTPEGTTVTVRLQRADPGAVGVRASPDRLTGVRPAAPHLAVILLAALLAGVAYGVAAEAVGGSVSIIGVFYGVESTVVGWLTHQFHSVVFAFAFAGLVTFLPEGSRRSLPAYVAVAVGWGLVLWLVAAGVVSAVWLRLLGIPATIPSLTLVSLAGHLAWGVSLGVLTALGYEYVVPRLRGFRAGLDRVP
jgi:signal transduction histidine kinase